MPTTAVITPASATKYHVNEKTGKGGRDREMERWVERGRERKAGKEEGRAWEENGKGGRGRDDRCDEG